METEPPCDVNGTHWHTATLPNQAAVDAWVDEMLRGHPKFRIGIPFMQEGPPERIEIFDPRPNVGPIGRTVALDGPITIGITLEESHGS